MFQLFRKWKFNCYNYVLLQLRKPSNPIELFDSKTLEKGIIARVYNYVISRKRKQQLQNAKRIAPYHIPILSVGNITFGATGKTPMILMMAKYLYKYQIHKDIMLLTRGYGNDEWRMFMTYFPTSILAKGKDRFHIGQNIMKENMDRINCVLIDDGLQQWRIHKDLEIIMIDTLHPFGNGQFIPFGSLRENPKDAIKRADIIILHHANYVTSPMQLINLEAQILTWSNPTKLPIIATSCMVVTDLLTPDEILESKLHVNTQCMSPCMNKLWNKWKGMDAIIFCGVGNPTSVELLVKDMNCWNTIILKAYPDHYKYTKSDLSDICLDVKKLEHKTSRKVVLLTTEKDFYRQSKELHDTFQQYEFRILKCELEIQKNQDKVLQAIDKSFIQYSYMCELGANVDVYRNDKITIDEIKELNPDRIMISPGPGFPKDAGISCDVIQSFAGKIPIAGVCLGLQCMYEVFGGTVGHAGEIVHGKQSTLISDGKGLFQGIPEEFKAIRYHSLVGLPETLPTCLEVTSRVKGTNMIMGVRHKTMKLEAVQFHPESILTLDGMKMIQNFLEM